MIVIDLPLQITIPLIRSPVNVVDLSALTPVRRAIVTGNGGHCAETSEDRCQTQTSNCGMARIHKLKPKLKPYISSFLSNPSSV